jgi:hypothetical protein
MNEERRARSQIKEWKTVETLFCEERNAGRNTIGAAVTVVQPIFENGGRGRPALSFKVFRNERILRFTCPKGSTEEIECLLAVMFDLDKQAGRIEDIFYDSYVKETSGNTSQPSRFNEPGGGLGRYSKPGKTQRKRRIRER